MSAYKNINIRKEFHSKYSEFCKNQEISIKEGTEQLVLYAIKHQLDLNTLNDTATSTAKDLINRVGDKVQNLQNTYVSFQRTFEGSNNYLLNLNILMVYQLKQFSSPDEAANFKIAFFEQAVLIRIATHPKQKVINSYGNTITFFKKEIEKEYLDMVDKVSKMAIFEIIELANKIVNDNLK